MIMQALRNTRPRPHSSDPALPVTGSGTHDLQQGLQAQERTVLTCRRLPDYEPARCGPGKTHQEDTRPLNAQLAQPPGDSREPHRNPTSRRPGPAPQVSHFSGGLSFRGQRARVLIPKPRSTGGSRLSHGHIGDRSIRCSLDLNIAYFNTSCPNADDRHAACIRRSSRKNYTSIHISCHLLVESDIDAMPLLIKRCTHILVGLLPVIWII